MTVSKRFLPHAGQVAKARRFVARVLEENRREVPDEVLIVASELVTNAIVHGLGEIELTVELRDESVQLIVRDEGGHPPVKSGPMPDALSIGGRGLPLVTAFSRTWGSQLDDEGHTVVWADLLVPVAA